jgi:hypothetical protein
VPARHKSGAERVDAGRRQRSVVRWILAASCVVPGREPRRESSRGPLPAPQVERQLRGRPPGHSTMLCDHRLSAYPSSRTLRQGDVESELQARV